MSMYGLYLQCSENGQTGTLILDVFHILCGEFHASYFCSGFGSQRRREVVCLSAATYIPGTRPENSQTRLQSGC